MANTRDISFISSAPRANSGLHHRATLKCCMVDKALQRRFECKFPVCMFIVNCFCFNRRAKSNTEMCRRQGLRVLNKRDKGRYGYLPTYGFDLKSVLSTSTPYRYTRCMSALGISVHRMENMDINTFQSENTLVH